MADANSGEGIASLKRVKITKAQRTMFIFVCGASVILGVTAVLVIFFAKTIMFENKLIEQKQYVVDALKADQKSLEGMSAQIDELSSNEYLESVPTDRYNTIDCSDYKGFNTFFSSFKTAEDVEKARLCSSLRVVHDAMPSTSSTISLDDVDSTTRIQIDLIMNRAEVSDVDSDDNGVTIENKGNSSSYNDSSSVSSLIEPYSMFDIGINVSGNLSKLKTFLSTIDSSIRNFDLRNASFSIDSATGQMEFSGDYYAYYTNPVDLQVMKRTICADAKSKECQSARGDQSVKKGEGGSANGSAATK